MRFWPYLLAATAACGSDSTHHLADGGPVDSAPDSPRADAPADAPADAIACSATHCCVPSDCVTGTGDAGSAAQFACEAHTCVDVAANLTGLLWSLPCTGAHSSTSCDTAPTATAMTTVGGTAGTTYDVAVHLRGVVEQKTYSRGCSVGSALAGGADNGDAFNVYELIVSSPPQVFFMNPGTSNIDNTFALDYPLTFRADAGATLTLTASSIDNSEIFNHDGSGAPISIAGTIVTQPFDGQFIEMDVESVVPDPIAAGATVGSGSAGHAIQLAGGQVAQIADAPGLRPADVTTEAWFQATSVTSDYNSIIMKVFGTGTEDSFAMWFQDGDLQSGVDLDSTANSTNFPFNPVDGAWHHVATTFDHATGTTTLYLDGAEASCSTNPVAIDYDAHPVRIGADVDNGTDSGFWIGSLDEVRLFSTARTADQVWADMHAHQLGPTAGLAGEWTFDEGSGQTSADSSGNGNPAVFGASTAIEGSDPTWVVSTVPH